MPVRSLHRIGGIGAVHSRSRYCILLHSTTNRPLTRRATNDHIRIDVGPRRDGRRLLHDLIARDTVYTSDALRTGRTLRTGQSLWSRWTDWSLWSRRTLRSRACGPLRTGWSLWSRWTGWSLWARRTLRLSIHWRTARGEYRTRCVAKDRDEGYKKSSGFGHFGLPAEGK